MHCYRILGSVQDAEDVAAGDAAGRLARARPASRAAPRCAPGCTGSPPTAASTRCATARRRPRRDRLEPVRPSRPSRRAGRAALAASPTPTRCSRACPTAPPGPRRATRPRRRSALAFVSGLQQLPPRQRAVLVLRDVLGFRAAEVAAMLDSTEASVNSALQRARATLDARCPSGPRARAAAALARASASSSPASPTPSSAATSTAVVALLTDDAWITMPPEPHEYQGRRRDRGVPARPRRSARAGAASGSCPTRANGQPAFGHYLERPARADVAPLGRPPRAHPRGRPDRRHHALRRQRRARLVRAAAHGALVAVRRRRARRRPAASPSSATAISRIRNFWTLPVTVIGNSSTNFQ